MPGKKEYQLTYFSPAGEIYLLVKSGRLSKVKLGRFLPGEMRQDERKGKNLFLKHLDLYFKAKADTFPFHLLSLDRVSEFQIKIYRQLYKVPFGKTLSYGELARAAGNAGAARAAGRALSANPLPIFIPCHRVINSDRSTGGYRWGRRWKKALLKHEGVMT